MKKDVRCQKELLYLHYQTTKQMQTTVLTAIGQFLDTMHGAGHDYSIKGYFGFAYLTINWADGPKKYRFEDLGDGTISRTVVD